MHLKQFEYISNSKMVLFIGLILCSPLATTYVEAQTVGLVDRPDRNYTVTRSGGTRIKTLRNSRCSNCSIRDTNQKSEYLKRVMTEHSTNKYQTQLETQIFADTKFVNGCWKNAIDRGMEFFFTVSETGVASDFAWFPKEQAGKCIKRHIASIAFPLLQKPHHSWLLVTGLEY